MTANQFAAICNAHGIAPAVALESDDVRSALAMAKTYPEFMRADGDALVEDAVAGSI